MHEKKFTQRLLQLAHNEQNVSRMGEILADYKKKGQLTPGDCQKILQSLASLTIKNRRVVTPYPDKRLHSGDSIIPTKELGIQVSQQDTLYKRTFVRDVDMLLH